MRVSEGLLQRGEQRQLQVWPARAQWLQGSNHPGQQLRPLRLHQLLRQGAHHRRQASQQGFPASLLASLLQSLRQ